MSYRNRLPIEKQEVFDAIVVSLQVRKYGVLKAMKVAEYSIKRKQVG